MNVRGPYKSQTQPIGVLRSVSMPVIWSLAVSAAAAGFINPKRLFSGHTLFRSQEVTSLHFWPFVLETQRDWDQVSCRCASCAPTNVELDPASKCKVEEALRKKDRSINLSNPSSQLAWMHRLLHNKVSFPQRCLVLIFATAASER